MIFLFALLPACAQSAANAALAGPYRIAGTVVNGVTGEPVKGATVAILTAEDNHTFASTESGSDGHFALERLPAEKFELMASKRGYVTSLYDQHEDFNSAIVTGADPGTTSFDTGNLVFKLAPDAVLSGVVTGDGGDPVDGAEVMLFKKPQGHEPDAGMERDETEMTDDTGAYEFSGLDAGEYLLAVRAQPWYAMHQFEPGLENAQESENETALDVAYPVTYFDSTTEEASATPIELTSGSRQEANVSLHAVPALHVDVSAPQKPGALPADVRQIVFGEPLPDEYASRGFVRSGEALEVDGLAPGEYQFQQGDPPRMVDMNLSASQQVDPGAGVPTVGVQGLVEDARGMPLKDGMVTLTPMRAAQGTTLPQALKQGAFNFDAVPPGTWSVQVTAPQWEERASLVMSVTAGERMQAGNQFTVTDRPLSLVVRVSTNPARLEGFARRDGKGISGVMVVLAPKDLGAMVSLGRRDQSDSDGSFALLNVTPGVYTIVAIADGWDLDWSDPAVIGRYLPGGVSVTVKDEADSTASSQASRRIRLAAAVPVQAR
jgi:hypothetical protein